MSTDQITEQAIRRLVDGFYLKVRANPDLGPIFARAIPGDWEAHLATMRNFWSSVMLTSGRYKGNPVAVHQRVEGIERMRSWAMVGQAGRTTSTSATDSFFQGTASSGGARDWNLARSSCRHRDSHVRGTAKLAEADADCLHPVASRCGRKRWRNLPYLSKMTGVSARGCDDFRGRPRVPLT
jgi:hypothetical protein